MPFQKKLPTAGYIIHVSAFQDHKDKDRRHGKNIKRKRTRTKNEFLTRSYLGNTTAFSKKIYLSIEATQDQIRKKIESEFKRYIKTKRDDFTVTVQKFQGKVRGYSGYVTNVYKRKKITRGKNKGKIRKELIVKGNTSLGLHVRSIKRSDNQKRVDKKNVTRNRIRKMHGKKATSLMTLENEMMIELNDKLFDLFTDLSKLELFYD